MASKKLYEISINGRIEKPTLDGSAVIIDDGGMSFVEMHQVDAVEVVHGRWETANDGTHFCSYCGCDAPYTWDDIDRSFINSADDVPDRPSNYCPGCGAKMDGDGNG